MTVIRDPEYSLAEIVRLGLGGPVTLTAENLRKLTHEIDKHPDILLKAERVSRDHYSVRLSLRLTPKKLEKELSNYA